MMKRRQFLNHLAGAGIIIPTLLPSGRLFSRSIDSKVDHVVYIIVGGGVRIQESIQKEILIGKYKGFTEGNLLKNILEGEAVDERVLNTLGIHSTFNHKKHLSHSIQKQGLLFPEMRLSVGPTEHRPALHALLCGRYPTKDLRNHRPDTPTLFEYVRKHLEVSPEKIWFIHPGNHTVSGYMDHSTHTDYGDHYKPCVLSSKPILHSPITGLELHVDNPTNASFTGREIELNLQKAHGLRDLQELTSHHDFENNEDIRSLYYSSKIMEMFRPKLTVIHLQSADCCHSNYTNYIKALQNMDSGIGWLWNYIQNQIPDMSGRTALFLLTDHGRNITANHSLDDNGLPGFDHNDQYHSRRTFGLITGPGIPQNMCIGSEHSPIGDISDGMMTVAHLLGIESNVQRVLSRQSFARNLLQAVS